MNTIFSSNCEAQFGDFEDLVLLQIPSILVFTIVFYNDYISLLGHPFPNESTKGRNRLNITLHFYIK